MKKFIAILMSTLMLLGILAGCGNTEPAPTTGDAGAVSTPVSAGLLVLNAAAALNISYDADGLVLNVEGIDDNGATLAGEYTDYLGKSCSDAVCDLIAASIHSAFLTPEENYVMIKQAVGSTLPGATFLETIQLDADNAIKAAGSTAALVMLTEENLDENGYINLESAKTLMLAYLSRDSFDVLEGSPTPINGQYSFRVTVGETTEDLIVDAVSGDVYEGTLEEAPFEDDTLDDTVEIVEPTDEVMVETQPATTAAATEPVAEPTTEPFVQEEVANEP